MRLYLVALTLFVLPHGAAAQPLPPLEGGRDIRLWAPSYGIARERAYFGSWRGDSISFVRREPPDSLELPIDALTRLDVLDGQSALYGALTGAGIVGAIGFLIGAVTTDCEPNDDWCSIGRIYYGGIGMLAGGALGGLIGSQFPMDIWVRQELPEPSDRGR